jgi:hypothetical protein
MTGNMRLIQYKPDGKCAVGLVADDGVRAHPLQGFDTVFQLAETAISQKRPLADLVKAAASTETVDYLALLKSGKVLPPIEHPEPARFFLTGTGLTHLGSADARNKMHVTTHGSNAPESDSMKIFRMGIKGGKPESGKIGVQPEWFYKGIGSEIVAPEAPMPLPGFALAGAEEPEVVGLYLVDGDGRPRRVGFTLGNEFSDHVTEAQNYLYTQHSKLRACSLGPELMIGELPQDIRGASRIIRDGKVLWQEEVLLGETNMSHSIANLEHFHFRYSMFRRPGDLHAYFMGAAVLSYGAGVKTQPGDTFEIDVPAFGQPLRNRMELQPDEGLVTVTPL